ncbi:MAG TPA: hypothetical protein PLO51_03020, partial [Candidatus Micrarchaeota archaeon]|nr:hypothetical protein [Candidatus Micrarchaeota archaeon]
NQLGVNINNSLAGLKNLNNQEKEGITKIFEALKNAGIISKLPEQLDSKSLSAVGKEIQDFTLDVAESIHKLYIIDNAMRACLLTGTISANQIAVWKKADGSPLKDPPLILSGGMLKSLTGDNTAAVNFALNAVYGLSLEDSKDADGKVIREGFETKVKNILSERDAIRSLIDKSSRINSDATNELTKDVLSPVKIPDGVDPTSYNMGLSGLPINLYTRNAYDIFSTVSGLRLLSGGDSFAAVNSGSSGLFATVQAKASYTELNLALNNLHMTAAAFGQLTSQDFSSQFDQYLTAVSNSAADLQNVDPAGTNQINQAIAGIRIMADGNMANIYSILTGTTSAKSIRLLNFLNQIDTGFGSIGNAIGGFNPARDMIVYGRNFQFGSNRLLFEKPELLDNLFPSSSSFDLKTRNDILSYMQSKGNNLFSQLPIQSRYAGLSEYYNGLASDKLVSSNLLTNLRNDFVEVTEQGDIKLKAEPFSQFNPINPSFYSGVYQRLNQMYQQPIFGIQQDFDFVLGTAQPSQMFSDLSSGNNQMRQFLQSKLSPIWVRDFLVERVNKPIRADMNYSTSQIDREYNSIVFRNNVPTFFSGPGYVDGDLNLGQVRSTGNRGLYGNLQTASLPNSTARLQGGFSVDETADQKTSRQQGELAANNYRLIGNN